MLNRLSRLAEMIVGSFPIKDPHLEQRQERQIVDPRLVHNSEPFSPSDHMSPQPIIKEEIWEDVIPPSMVCSLRILPVFDNPVEGVLGNLENPPQCFIKQKRRGRLSCRWKGNVPNLTTECAPFC